MNTNETTTKVVAKDFSPKLKFIVTIGSQLLVGVLAIGVTAAVTVALAKSTEAVIDAVE